MQDDIKIMSIVECVSCGCRFSVDLDSGEVCPYCGENKFVPYDFL